MNTTAAALQANVTVDTVRYWCRYGVVAAVKAAGRWVIDTASLAARIRIGKERRMSKPEAKPVELTVETLTAIGGNEWIRGDKHRVYLNDWHQYLGLEIAHYKSGNISSAALDGKGISNAEANRILGAVSKVFYDTADGKIHIQGYGNPRSLDRDEIAERIHSGIRAAIAAL